MTRGTNLALIALLSGGCVVQADDDVEPAASDASSPESDGPDDTAPPEDDSSSSDGDDDGSSSSGGGGGGGEPSFAGDTLPIIAANCSCHRGDLPSAGLDLGDDAAYDSLVDTPAGASGLDYVEPGDVESSYLVHKLRGSHESVGGFGDQMPLGGQLSADDLQTVEDWVAEGAFP